MLAAATELLEGGGMAAVTHQAVALAAGVGRATVYRHWPRPLDLLLATLNCAKAGSIDFGDGPIRDALYANFMRRIEWFNQPVSSTVIGALISGSEHDPDIAQIRDSLFKRIIGNMEMLIRAAATRGEVATATPAHTVATMIIGAITFERHMLGSTITPETLATIIDTALKPWLASKA
jgi:AcrR family transcriptional regulator